MTLKIGYFIPEFPGQTHGFFWREIQALRKSDVLPELVSTRIPNQILISHSWASEARSETKYLFPLKFRSALGALWTLFRAGPLGWWRALSTLAGSEGSVWARLKLLPMLFMGAELAWLARRRGWTHVHVHSCGNAANVALFAHRLSGIPYSLTLHGVLRDYGPNQKKKWTHSAFALVVTRKLRQEVEHELAGFLPRAIGVAPMGVDLKRFPAEKAYHPWTGSGPCRLFSCGRLNPVKGHDDLFRAVALLRDQGLGVELHVAGEDDTAGGYRGDLERLLGELNLTPNVKLLGAVSEETVRSELEAAHVFALGSREEAIGVATMEAMAMKVPVVVTAPGGVRELVDDGVNGLLVEPGVSRQMAQSLLQVLRDPALAVRLGEAGRRKIESSFHSGVGAEVLRQSILAAGGPAASGSEEAPSPPGIPAPAPGERR